MVQFLLASKASVNAIDDDSKLAIQKSLFHSYYEVSLALIEAGSQIDWSDEEGLTPLHHAVIGSNSSPDNDPRCVSLIISKGGNVNAKDRMGNHPIHFSQPTTTKILIEAGADVDARDGDQRTPLMHALYNRDTELVRLLLGSGASLECRDEMGRTVLHWAVCGGDLDMVELILSQTKKTLIELPDIEGKVPLHWAANYNHAEVGKMLILNGANMSAKELLDGASPLDFCCFNGNAEFARMLLSHSCEPNTVGKLDRRPIHWAAQTGTAYECIQVLIEYGADVNVRDVEGMTPLHSAASVGNLDEARLLIQAECNVNARDTTGRTALHCFMGNLDDIYSMFEEEAGEIRLKSLLPGESESQTEEESQEIAELLEDQMSDMIDDLLSAGSDLVRPDKYNRTPLAIGINSALATSSERFSAYLNDQLVDVQLSRSREDVRLNPSQSQPKVCSRMNGMNGAMCDNGGLKSVGSAFAQRQLARTTQNTASKIFLDILSSSSEKSDDNDDGNGQGNDEHDNITDASSSGLSFTPTSSSQITHRKTKARTGVNNESRLASASSVSNRGNRATRTSNNDNDNSKNKIKPSAHMSTPSKTSSRQKSNNKSRSSALSSSSSSSPLTWISVLVLAAATIFLFNPQILDQILNNLK